MMANMRALEDYLIPLYLNESIDGQAGKFDFNAHRTVTTRGIDFNGLVVFCF